MSKTITGKRLPKEKQRYKLFIKYPPDNTEYELNYTSEDLYEALYWVIRMNKVYKTNKLSCRAYYRKTT